MGKTECSARNQNFVFFLIAYWALRIIYIRYFWHATPKCWNKARQRAILLRLFRWNIHKHFVASNHPTDQELLEKSVKCLSVEKRDENCLLKFFLSAWRANETVTIYTKGTNRSTRSTRVPSRRRCHSLRSHKVMTSYIWHHLRDRDDNYKRA